MKVKVAKIDFIMCEHNGYWFTESHNVPLSIACKSNEEICQWVKEHLLIDEYFFVGVYWNDPNIKDLN